MKTWYQRFREIAERGFTPFRPKAASEASSAIVVEAEGDLLTRCDVGDFVGDAFEDGPHWRFENKSLLGKRVIVRAGIVMEVTDVHPSKDGPMWMTRRAKVKEQA